MELSPVSPPGPSGMPLRVNLVVDFDSTFIDTESLDLLLRHVIGRRADGAGLRERFASITNAGMEGRIPFSESLSERIALLTATRHDVAALGDRLARPSRRGPLP